MSSDLRKLLDIVTQSLPSDDLLTEAKNYGEMFNDVRKAAALLGNLFPGSTIVADTEDMIKKGAKAFAASLKREDRIVWALRLAKLGCLYHLIDTASSALSSNNIEDNTAQIQDAVAKITAIADKQASVLAQKANSSPDHIKSDAMDMRNALTKAAGERNNSSVLEKFEHFFSLGVAGINDYQFAYQDYETILQHFEMLESKWKEDRKQSFDHDLSKGEVIMRFPDGMFWELLDRGACQHEGNAMGHCGNVPSVKSGDRLISLRKIITHGGKTLVRPSLTFILNRNGMLGEMKGRGNNKPDRKYHPHIIALLKSDLIEGIVGGGYRPENNFSLSDLTPQEQEDLLEEKPELGTLYDVYKTMGVDSDKFKAKLESTLDGFNLTYEKIEDNQMIIGYFDDVGEYADTAGDEVVHELNEIIVGNIDASDIELGEEIKITDDDIEDLIDGLRTPEYASLMRHLGLMNIPHNDSSAYRKNLKMAVQEFKHDRKMQRAMDDLITLVNEKRRSSKEMNDKLKQIASDLMDEYIEAGLYYDTTPADYKILPDRRLEVSVRLNDAIKILSDASMSGDNDDIYDNEYYDLTNAISQNYGSPSVQVWLVPSSTTGHYIYFDDMNQRREENDLPIDKQQLYSTLIDRVGKDAAPFDIRKYVTAFSKIAEL